jgi:hypothetical protein
VRKTILIALTVVALLIGVVSSSFAEVRTSGPGPLGGPHDIWPPTTN